METMQSTNQRVTARTLAFVGAGVVAAPVTLLLSGAVTAIYLSDGLTWIGVLLAVMLVAAATWLAGHWPIGGITAGLTLGVIMVVFAFNGTSPSSRPEIDFIGAIILGGAGLLSAALVSAYLITGLISRRASAPRP